MGAGEEPIFEVLSPVPARRVHEGRAAPRLPDLAGRTVGELWDVMFRGELVFPLVREHFRRRFPGVRFVEYDHFGNIYGPADRDALAALPDRLRAAGVDAVIVGIGA